MSRAAAASVAIVLVIVATASKANAQDWRTITSLRQYKGEEALNVDVEYGAGRLSITPGETNALYKATLRYDANSFRPLSQYQDGRLQVGVDDNDRKVKVGRLRVGIEGGSVKGRNMKAGRLDLALGTKVPIDLNLKFGAGKAELELGGLKIRSAQIQTGASETELNVSSANAERCSRLEFQVGAAEFRALGLGNLNCERINVAGGVGAMTLDFNGAWAVNTDVDIDMGLGALTLRVPRGLGVQVRKTGFLGSFDSQGLTKRGNVYYSENWDTASNRASFNIDAAFGSIRVVWVEPDAKFSKAQR